MKNALDKQRLLEEVTMWEAKYDIAEQWTWQSDEWRGSNTCGQAEVSEGSVSVGRLGGGATV